MVWYNQFDFQKYCQKYCQYTSKNSVFCAPVTADEITKIICNLPSNKAPGMDNICAKVLTSLMNI